MREEEREVKIERERGIIKDSVRYRERGWERLRERERERERQR